MSNDGGLTRGVLYSKKSEENYVLMRVQPSFRLCDLIETFWMVTWDNRCNEPHIQENIPDPCINMVFEPQRSRIVGAVTKRYSVQLAGKGQIFGIKFHPGGFYALSKVSASSFTDTSIQIEGVFGHEGLKFVDRVMAASDIELMVKISEGFLLPGVPKYAESVKKITGIINKIEWDQTITRVEQLSDRFGLSVRGLQRLFNDQVGVSPKWVIRKYRMREVLSRLEKGEQNWQEVITHLDYFDQSHFVKDFKSLIGITPSEYIDRLKQS